MNADNNSVITAAFRRALVNPGQPQEKFPGGGAGRIEINQSIQVLVLYRDDKPHLILHISSGGGYHFCSQGSCGVAVTPDGSYKALSYLPGTITVPLGFMRIRSSSSAAPMPSTAVTRCRGIRRHTAACGSTPTS